MAPVTHSLFRIQPALQKYAWGIATPSAWAARVAQVDGESGPYAEAWLGAHPNGPAKVIGGENDGLTLTALVDANPNDILGESSSLYDGTFPFLAKVLSVAQPLSIQLHPRAEDAKRLHDARPEHYPDPNPKDEASIAITEVELLYGLKSIEEILSGIESVPTLPTLLEDCLGELRSGKHGQEEAAKLLFEAIWRLDESQVQEVCAALFAKLEATARTKRSAEEQWILKLKPLYPLGDVGIFAFYLMELLHLKPGEGISISCGTPHAYLSGEFFELMTPSDNVIRCGLTPKYRDDDELFRCANYSQVEAPIIKSTAETLGSLKFRSYDLGGHFCIDLFQDKGKAMSTPANSPEIILSLDANGSLRESSSYQFVPGDAFVVPAACSNYEISLQSGRLARFRLPN